METIMDAREYKAKFVDVLRGFVEFVELRSKYTDELLTGRRPVTEQSVSACYDWQKHVEKRFFVWAGWLGWTERAFWRALQKTVREQVGSRASSVRKVRCKFCGRSVSIDKAHRHQSKYVGECCWDERLRTTE